jgi:hypothetical protein
VLVATSNAPLYNERASVLYRRAEGAAPSKGLLEAAPWRAERLLGRSSLWRPIPQTIADIIRIDVTSLPRTNDDARFRCAEHARPARSPLEHDHDNRVAAQQRTCVAAAQGCAGF